MGRDEARRAFRFTDTDGRLLALRPDVTSSVARAAATLFAAAPAPPALLLRRLGLPPAPALARRVEATGTAARLRAVRRRAAPTPTSKSSPSPPRCSNASALRGAYRVTLNHVGVFNGVAEQLGLDGGGARARCAGSWTRATPPRSNSSSRRSAVQTRLPSAPAHLARLAGGGAPARRRARASDERTLTRGARRARKSARGRRVARPRRRLLGRPCGRLRARLLHGPRLQDLRRGRGRARRRRRTLRRADRQLRPPRAGRRLRPRPRRADRSARPPRLRDEERLGRPPPRSKAKTSRSASARRGAGARSASG